MDSSQAIECLKRLQAIWPQTNMSEATAREYMRVLVTKDVDEMTHSINMLSQTSKWLPTIAELVRGSDVYLDDDGEEIDENSWHAQQLGSFLKSEEGRRWGSGIDV